jgi:hypothetical protein
MRMQNGNRRQRTTKLIRRSSRMDAEREKNLGCKLSGQNNRRRRQ